MRFLSIIFCFFTLLSSPILDALTPADIPIVKCANNRMDQRKCELSICAIFRDEGPYLKEWIEFHRLVGVSHFYLYNNLSQDIYWEVLQPYITKGIVELFDVPFDSCAYNDGAKTHNFVQVCCYTHAINLASKSNWLAIIDVDEFICPVIDKDIPTALTRYPKAGGLVVYWQIYGTSNIWDLQPGELMIEKLLLKEPNKGGKGLFKTIIRPKYAGKCMDPHYTKTKHKLLITPNDQKFHHKRTFSLLPVDVIRINHYTFRTASYYFNYKKPRRARWGYAPSPEVERADLDGANAVYDPVMLRFVVELKKRMGM